MVSRGLHRRHFLQASRRFLSKETVPYAFQSAKNTSFSRFILESSAPYKMKCAVSELSAWPLLLAKWAERVRGGGVHRSCRGMVTRGWRDDDTGAGTGREAGRRRPRGRDRGPGRFHRGSFALLVCILACRVASAGASPKLSALSFVGDIATLTPAFDPDTLSYNASVTTDRTSVQLAYAVASPDSASLVEVTTAVTQPSGRRRRNLLSSTTSALAISPGHNDVTLTVRRTTDNAATAYAVRVTAYSLAAHVSLSGLSLVVGSTPVALPGPGFQANTLTYDVTVDYTTSAVSITPTAAYAAKCTMTVNGVAHTSGQAKLNVATPTQSISAASQSRGEYRLPSSTMEPSITGRSFADLSTVCVGMSM